MNQGQIVTLKATNRQFTVEVTDAIGSTAIVRSPRTGGRLFVAETGRGVYARQVVDNGKVGDLFATLDPVGPRWACWPVRW